MAFWSGWIDKIRIPWRVLRHPDAPKTSKVLLVLAAVYLVWPIDFVTDFAPFIGLTDDLAVVAALVTWAMKIVPEDVMRQCSRKRV